MSGIGKKTELQIELRGRSCSMLEAFHDAAVSGVNIFTSNCRESGRWEDIGRLGSLGEEWQLE